jgi:hypothetical protein
VVVTISGSDVGELGDRPFKELDKQLAAGPFALFIDARATRGASVDVSNVWARWLRTHRDELTRIHMLTRSRFVQVTADFVRRFAELPVPPLVFEEQASVITKAAAVPNAMTPVPDEVEFMIPVSLEGLRIVVQSVSPQQAPYPVRVPFLFGHGRCRIRREDSKFCPTVQAVREQTFDIACASSFARCLVVDFGRARIVDGGTVSKRGCADANPEGGATHWRAIGHVV